MLVAISIGACNDKLSLDPQQNVDTEEALTTSDGVKNYLTGIYAEIAGQTNTTFGGELYGGDFNLISELMGSDGEVAWSGTFATFRQIYLQSIVDNNAVITGDWIRAYKAINACNLVLAHLDVLGAADQATVEGEALAIRSFLFFELVRLYALPYEAGEANAQPGIPLVTDPTVELSDITEEDYVLRDPVADVYTKVIADLLRAEGLLPEYNGIKIDKYAVLAMLSRVYLQQGEYALARDAADEVIASGGYALLNDFTRCFNNNANTDEDIFAIQQSSLFNSGTSNSGLTTFYANSDQSGRDGDIDVLTKHLNLYDDGDVRGAFFYAGVNDALPKTNKWFVEYANISVIRLAEMYLTRAEANFVLGETVGATPVEDLNQIITRAGLEALPEDATLTLDQILNERRKELAFEGLRLHDLKRNHLSVSGTSYNSEDLLLPIPRREKENNSNLDD